MEDRYQNFGRINIVSTLYDVEKFISFIARSDIVSISIPTAGENRGQDLFPQFILTQSISDVYLIDISIIAGCKLSLDGKKVILDIKSSYRQISNVFDVSSCEIIDVALGLAFCGESIDQRKSYTMDVKNIELAMKIYNLQKTIDESTCALHNVQKVLDMPREKLIWYEEEKLITQCDDQNPFDDIMNHSEKKRFDAVNIIRKEIASEANVLENYVMTTSVVIKIAILNPQTFDSLQDIIGINKAFFTGAVARKIIKAIAGTKQEDISEISRINLKKINFYNVYIVRALAEGIAAQKSISSKLLIDEDEILAFTLGSKSISFLSGWKYGIFGKYAIDILNGKCGISSIDGKINIA